MPSAGVDALVEAAAAITTEADMLAIFREYYAKTVVRGEWHREYSEIPFDPRVQARFGRQTSLFYLVAYLSALPHAEREYLRRGIDLHIFHDTMRDVTTWYQHEFDLTGVWEFKQFHWVWQSLACVMFRLGRMQYTLKPFDGGIHAFRSLTGGQILLLADPQMPLRADGCARGAGKLRPDDPDPQPDGSTWQPVFEEDEKGWTGHPVSPYGTAERQPIQLSRTDWALALQPGDTVLDLHIPRKDSFTVEDCRESMRQAYEFFPKQFPEQPFKASYCHTWFFTPQLQQMLPAESNVVRFQREFYLFPYPGGPGFLWAFVFGERYQSIPDAPRDTSLRRAVLEWLEASRELFDLPGLRFHGPEEWGSQIYMRAWDREHPEAQPQPTNDG